MKKIFTFAVMALFAFPAFASAKSSITRASKAGSGGGGNQGAPGPQGPPGGVISSTTNLVVSSLTSANLTSTGTVKAPVYLKNGFDIASTSETALLKSTQTFSGSPTFTSSVTVVNQMEAQRLFLGMTDDNYSRDRAILRISTGANLSNVEYITVTESGDVRFQVQLTSTVLKTVNGAGGGFFISGSTGVFINGSPVAYMGNTQTFTGTNNFNGVTNLSTATVSSMTVTGGLSISGNGPALFSGNGTSVTLTMGGVAGSSIIVNASGLVVPGFATFVTSFPVELARDWEYLNFSSAVVSLASMTGFGKVVFDGQNSSNTVMTYRLRVPALANPNYNVTLSTFETVSTGTITTADIENYQVSICTRVGGGLTVDADSLVYVSTVNFSITPSVGGTRTMNQVAAPVTLTGWGSLLETGDRDVYIRLVRVDAAKKNSYLLSAILNFIRRW